MVRSKGSARGPLALVSRDADTAFYAREVRQWGAPVLVLGCASGRIAWELAQDGARVTAVDPSKVMLEVAQGRRGEAPLEVSARLEFHEADLRTLRLNRRFGSIVLPQNAVGLMPTLEALDALFATVCVHLAPTGALLLDATNPGPPEPSGTPEDAVPPYLEPRRPLFAPHLRERRRDPRAPPSSAIRRLRVGQFYPAEMDAALLRSGLRAAQRYGDFAGKPFDPADALQVVIASPADGAE